MTGRIGLRTDPFPAHSLYKQGNAAVCAGVPEKPRPWKGTEETGRERDVKKDRKESIYNRSESSATTIS
jgi:hypothetical protein